MLSTARQIWRHPSAMLLALQLLAVIAYPFLLPSTVGRAVLGGIGMVAVVVAVYAVRRTPAVSWFTSVLGVPALVFTLLEAARPGTDWIVLASAATHAPFYLYVSYAMIRYLFHDEVVSRDEVFATAAAFTVVAWAFAYIFSAVQVLWPGSFVSPAGVDQSWFELLFVSFTSLTSVGLSDIVPVTGQARSVVILAEVAGVFYVALVVARLVALTVVRQRTR